MIIFIIEDFILKCTNTIVRLTLDLHNGRKTYIFTTMQDELKTI